MAENIFGKEDFFERLFSLMGGGSLGDLAGRISTNNPPTITDH